MSSLSEQYKQQQELKGDQKPSIFSTRNLLIAIGGLVFLIVFIYLISLTGIGLPKSDEQKYNDDLQYVHDGVLLYSTGYSPKVVTYMEDGGAKTANMRLGKRPTYAMTHLGTGKAVLLSDMSNGVITTLGKPETNPLGGAAVGHTPSWEDVDGDGQRRPEDDVLYYQGASPEPARDHWNTVTVTADGASYIVDSRDWFVNLDRMLDGRFVDYIPLSASPDNCAQCTGSYSYYLDENLEVKSLKYTAPTIDSNGYQGVYP